MNRRISVIWAGVAVVAIFAIGALAYSGWNVGLLLHPWPIALLVLAGLSMIWYMHMRVEPYSKVRDFVLKYRVIQIFQIVLLVVAVILFAVNGGFNLGG